MYTEEPSANATTLLQLQSIRLQSEGERRSPQMTYYILLGLKMISDPEFPFFLLTVVIQQHWCSKCLVLVHNSKWLQITPFILTTCIRYVRNHSYTSDTSVFSTCFLFVGALPTAHVLTFTRWISHHNHLPIPYKQIILPEFDKISTNSFTSCHPVISNSSSPAFACSSAADLHSHFCNPNIDHLFI